MMPQHIEYGFLFILGLTIISAARLMYYQHRCCKYLREKHTEKWKEITTIFGFGPGLVNGIKGMKFLLGKDDLGDPEFLRLKILFRNSLIYLVTGIGATFIMFCITGYAYAKL
jgi:hypothetical protein